jgi:hypothetical protein
MLAIYSSTLLFQMTPLYVSHIHASYLKIPIQGTVTYNSQIICLTYAGLGNLPLTTSQQRTSLSNFLEELKVEMVGMHRLKEFFNFCWCTLNPFRFLARSCEPEYYCCEAWSSIHRYLSTRANKKKLSKTGSECVRLIQKITYKSS